MQGASIEQDSCITTICKKTCFESIGDLLEREGGLNKFFLSKGRLIREGDLLERGG